MTKNHILFIIPLPPPVSGAAIAAETVTNYMKKHHDIKVINYERGNLISGKFSFKQLFKIIILGIKIAINRRRVNSVYMIVSSTFLGNLRDMFLLVIMGKRLRENTVLHLHGSNIDKYLSAAPLWIKSLNKRMLGDVKSAIVLGETFKNIFDGYISSDKISIVRNFIKNNLFIKQGNIQDKFKSNRKINILFLSNLMKEKGYEIILDAFISLNEDIRNNAILHFAGVFFSDAEKSSFLEKIENKSNIIYHGPIGGEKKQRLLWNSHIFCLPTYYKFEGQPISILEAYAAGCIVLTTTKGGIRDIFTDNKNGFYVKIGDIDSLREKLDKLIMNITDYRHIAYFNLKEASEKYTEEMFCRNIESILLSNLAN